MSAGSLEESRCQCRAMMRFQSKRRGDSFLLEVLDHSTGFVCLLLLLQWLQSGCLKRCIKSLSRFSLRPLEDTQIKAHCNKNKIIKTFRIIKTESRQTPVLDRPCPHWLKRWQPACHPQVSRASSSRPNGALRSPTCVHARRYKARARAVTCLEPPKDGGGGASRWGQPAVSHQ